MKTQIAKLGRVAWALFSLLLATSGVQAQELVIEPGEPITIGVMTAQRGAETGIGIASERGTLLAQEEQPSLRFEDLEFPIELEHHDSACSDVEGAAVAMKLVAEERAVAVIGPNCSSACLAAAPIFDEAGYTSLSPTCTAPTLTEQGFRSFHRMVSSDALTAQRAARFLYEEWGGRRLALLHTSDENPTFYEGQVAVLTAEITALGGAIVSEIAVTAETDYATVVATLEEATPDQLFCACEPEAAAALLAALAESELAAVPLMGAEINWAHQLIELAGMAAEGVTVISGEAEPSEANTALAARYEERFSEAPDSPYYSNAYDAYQLVLAAIESVGVLDDEGNLRIDRAALNTEIRGTSDYAGVTGHFTCDENGECLRSPTSVFRIQEGTLTTLLTYDE